LTLKQAVRAAKEDGHFTQAAGAAASKLGRSNLKELVEVVWLLLGEEGVLLR